MKSRNPLPRWGGSGRRRCPAGGRWGLTATLLLTLLLTACDLSTDEPRTLPEPDFDARAVFEGADIDDDDIDDDLTDDDFEARIQQAMDDDTTATDDDEAATRSLRTVPVGRALVSEIPDDHETWRWSRRGDTTLISKTPPGETPRALILATPRPAGPASRAMRTFIGDIDPALAAEYGLPITPPEFTKGDLADEMDGDVGELLALLGGADSLTGGRGMGYRSQPDTFTGWRWMGRSDEDLFFRIASSRGQWGAQPPLTDRVGSDLDGLIEQMGGDADLFDELDIDGGLEELEGISIEGDDTSAPEGDRPSPPESPFANRPPQRAQIFFGEVETGTGTAMSIALLCVAEPRCEAADEFAHFLDRLRADRAPRSAHETDFDEHTESLGLQLGRE